MQKYARIAESTKVTGVTFSVHPVDVDILTNWGNTILLYFIVTHTVTTGYAQI